MVGVGGSSPLGRTNLSDNIRVDSTSNLVIHCRDRESFMLCPKVYLGKLLLNFR